MRHYSYETVVETPPHKLYRAITDITKWPVWDPELEATAHDDSLARGAAFTLSPRGGPRVKLTVEEARAAAVFADVAHLPLAKMRTRHEFAPTQQGTRVRVSIEVWGPLGFLWDRLVARKQAAGLGEQTKAFVQYAEAL